MVVNTAAESVAASTRKSLQALEALGYLPLDDRGYSEEEEGAITERLRALGYI